MGGAKNCPETPRQKMIGMMYLVLTAMLALNVSSSILEGFTMVDNSLHTTITSANERNKAQYSDFQFLYDKNPTKVKEWLEKAKQVKAKSDELYNYIEKFKVDIVKLTDADEANDSAYVKQIKAKDNLDKAGEYGIVKGNGKKLREKINDYTKFLVDLSAGNEAKIKMYQSIFATAKTGGKPWEEAMFESMPVAAVVTILTKYQSDVRAAEAEIVQYLKAQTDASDFRVNKIQAFVIPDSRYVIRGDRYKAQIVLSAVDSTQTPQYYVNGASVPKGLYEVGCTSVGPKTYSGQISIPGNDGIMRSYPFKGDYMVGEPSATMSNEDLNVVYKGIDNKFSVSVPGVAAANISIRVDGGSGTQVSPGRFIIRPARDGEIRINVFAKIDKKDLAMGGANYRVKYLPDPKAFLQPNDAGAKPIRGGFMSPSLLKSSALIASYGNDELVKANFTVTGFTMIAKGLTPQTVSGSRLSSNFVDKLLKGDILMINNIKAVGPDQKVRDLGSISIQL
ncbi:MAG: gliding motility protein GldM [Paludibacter sp.]